MYFCEGAKGNRAKGTTHEKICIADGDSCRACDALERLDDAETKIADLQQEIEDLKSASG